MEFQLNRVNPPGKPPGTRAKPEMKMTGESYPGSMLREGSAAAGLIADTNWLLITALWLKPSRALLTRAGLKTWLSSRAAMWRVTSDKTDALPKPSGVVKGESSYV